MLYKVTPAMETPAPEKKQSRVPGQARPRRKSAIYDSEGSEVLITLMCLKCRQMKPLGQFGLRKMADGAIRNQPWCRPCRSAASTKKKPDAAEAAPKAELAPLPDAEPEVLPVLVATPVLELDDAGERAESRVVAHRDVVQVEMTPVSDDPAPLALESPAAL